MLSHFLGHALTPQKAEKVRLRGGSAGKVHEYKLEVMSSDPQNPNKNPRMVPWGRQRQEGP